MKDLYKTLDYAHEFTRMCRSHHVCKGCPLQYDTNCRITTSITPSRIEAVKKWSEAHPEQLNGEKLIEDFKAYWGQDFDTEADYELYKNLLTWLQEELEKI